MDQEFLAKKYDPREIETFSADEGRVQRSAMSYFMGLYPPQDAVSDEPVNLVNQTAPFDLSLENDL